VTVEVEQPVFALHVTLPETLGVADPRLIAPFWPVIVAVNITELP
jgi:hypothetical protein